MKKRGYINNSSKVKLEIPLFSESEQVLYTKDEEILSEDKLFGLTRKYFESDYLTVKKGIMKELESLACQIGDYLKLKDSMIRAKR